MKTLKLLLLALVPGVLGCLFSHLVAMALSGPGPLFSLIYNLQAPAAIVFCLWLGHRCGRSERSYSSSLLLTQWPSLVSFALYVWQFWFVPAEARGSLLAGLGEYPSILLLLPATRLVWPFAGSDWGTPETTAATAISLVLLAVLFSLGFLWGRRSRSSAS